MKPEDRLLEAQQSLAEAVEWAKFVEAKLRRYKAMYEWVIQRTAVDNGDGTYTIGGETIKGGTVDKAILRVVDG